MTDRLRDAAQRALESLDDLIANTTDPGVEALGARSELATALINDSLEPTLFENGGANDIRELYVLHEAIKAYGGEVTRPVHRAIDALRAVWDAALRREQERTAPTS